jgi:V/A-type H+/Na+-transporting ATPase subunit K
MIDFNNLKRADSSGREVCQGRSHPNDIAYRAGRGLIRSGVMNRQILFAGVMVLGVALLAGISSLLLWQTGAIASEVVAVEVMPIHPDVLRWGYLAAALATMVGSVAAAYAVATIGAAAVGALAEKPELFGRLVILVGLAEGIAIYGLIISVLILNRLG